MIVSMGLGSPGGLLVTNGLGFSVIASLFKGLQRFNCYIHQKAVIFLER